MIGKVPGPDGNNPTQSGEQPKQVQTGISKMYTAAKAPGFAEMLNHWFPGQVTEKMVTAFEQGIMKMISNSINQAKIQHAKVQKKIKERIEEKN